MGIITAAVAPVLFSALSRTQNNDKEFRSIYYKFQRMTAIFVIPMGIGIFLFSDVVTKILLGEQWMEASGFMGLWGLTSAFTIVFSYFASEVYRSKGKPVISLFTQLGQIAVLVPVLLIFKQYGFRSLYIARSLVRIEIILCAFIVMSVMFNIKARDIFKNTLPMIVSALIMGLAGYGLRLISDSMIWQFVAIFLCVIVYFGVLFLAFPNTRKDALDSPYAQKLVGKIKSFTKK
jgi:PST family polysaccharide transporter